MWNCGPLDLTKSYSICSIHFTKDDYIANAGRPMLIEYKLPIYSNIKSIDKNLLCIIKNLIINYVLQVKIWINTINCIF